MWVLDSSKPLQTAQIAVTFKDRNSAVHPKPSNVLFIRIQPEMGGFLKTVTKVPSLLKSIDSVTLGYKPDTCFEKPSPEAYEKLFYDSVKGDNSLFVHEEEQLAAWRVLTPILNDWNLKRTNTQTYDAGTWGPSVSKRLLEENGHRWLLLEDK